uniref:Uncharacterized protein n=1 Tax=viral metagenome TaxID=1070528 RepID=A0A6C0HMM6_9ZZZZ
MVFTLAEAWFVNYKETLLNIVANPLAYTPEEVKALDKQVAQVSAIIKAHLADLAARAAARGIYPIKSIATPEPMTPEPMTPEPMTPEPMTPEPMTPMIFDDAQTPPPATPPATPPVTRKKRNWNCSPKSPDSPSNSRRRTGPQNREDPLRQRLQF